MNLTSKTSLLAFLARSNPRIWEIIHPNVPILSVGTRHVMAAMVIKFVARDLKDTDIAAELQWVGKSLFEAGAKSMSYDDDDWCPTRPRPHFEPQGPQPEPWSWIFGGSEVMLNPQPLPPRSQVYYGALITLLADAVVLESIPDTLRNIGASLMEKYANEVNENTSPGVTSYSNLENGN